jgi:hypothetical protein
MDKANYRLTVAQLWTTYDKNNDGILSIEEAKLFAKDLLQNMAKRLNRDFDLFIKSVFHHKDVSEAVEFLVKEMDQNHDGQITHDEFDRQLAKFIGDEDKAIAVSLLGPERQSIIADIQSSVRNFVIL